MAKILLVEDDDAVRTMLCDAMEFAGHEVTSVRRRAEATAALAGPGYAILVADARLPD